MEVTSRTFPIAYASNKSSWIAGNDCVWFYICSHDTARTNDCTFTDRNSLEDDSFEPDPCAIADYNRCGPDVSPVKIFEASGTSIGLVKVPHNSRALLPVKRMRIVVVDCDTPSDCYVVANRNARAGDYGRTGPYIRAISDHH
jgi:hypothetical protein